MNPIAPGFARAARLAPQRLLARSEAILIMYESPRLRRLRNDLKALEQLQEESSVFRFTANGNPPDHYRLVFRGRGLWRDHGQVRPLEKHHVDIKLGPSYPRALPEIRWLTPIFHPNISEIGMVCLGGYGTHWAPSVQLGELCLMLWDMLRYQNYDIRSPYNRDAALWVAGQATFSFPTDPRSLRDRRAALGRVAATGPDAPAPAAGPAGASAEDRLAAVTPMPGPAAAAAAQSQRSSERVRSFVNRYAWAFGTGPAAGPGRDAPEGEIASPPSTRAPRSEALALAVEAMSSSEAEGRGPEPILRLGDGDAPMARRPAREGASSPSSAGPPATSELRPSGPPPSNDEIVFIE